MNMHFASWPIAQTALGLNAKRPDAHAFLSLAGKTDDLGSIQTLANTLRARFSDMVVVGAGGSGMSGKLLASLSHESSHHVHVLDNLDILPFDRLTKNLDPKRTCVAFISKSGTTPEVIVTVDLLSDWLKRSGINPTDHFCVITTPDGNALHRFAETNQLRTLACDPDLGGRFSVLSSVGLLPAAFAGVDIKKLREGASNIDVQALGASVAAQKQLIAEGKTNQVMMVYDEALVPLALWWQQVFSESLGKDGKGAGGVVALGPRDQHSQLQLYMQGPPNYYFTFLSCARNPATHVISNDALLPEFRGKPLAAVIDAMHRGTMDSMIAAGKPVRHIHFDSLNETSVAAFLQSMMVEIVALGEALDINPFGQPAVEASKQLTKQYLT